jgi:hypothetical protein
MLCFVPSALKPFDKNTYTHNKNILLVFKRNNNTQTRNTQNILKTKVRDRKSKLKNKIQLNKAKAKQRRSDETTSTNTLKLLRVNI